MASLTNVMLLKEELMAKVLDTFKEYYKGIFHKDVIPASITAEITEFSSDGSCYFNVTIDGELVANCSMEVSESPSIVTIDFLYLNGSLYTKMDVFIEDLAILALIKYLNKKEMFLEAGVFKFFQTRCCKYNDLIFDRNKIVPNKWHIMFKVTNKEYSIRMVLVEDGCYCLQGYYQGQDTGKIESITYSSRFNPKDIKTCDDFLEILFKYYTMLQVAQV